MANLGLISKLGMHGRLLVRHVNRIIGCIERIKGNIQCQLLTNAIKKKKKERKLGHKKKEWSVVERESP